MLNTWTPSARTNSIITVGTRTVDAAWPRLGLRADRPPYATKARPATELLFGEIAIDKIIASVFLQLQV